MSTKLGNTKIDPDFTRHHMVGGIQLYTPQLVRKPSPLSTSGSFGAGHKRANEDAFAEGSAQPAKKGPGSMRYPCPRPGGCPAEATNHIRKGTCEGCNFDIHSHTVARKKAEDEARKEKVPPLPVVLKAANREIERLHILGCSASLMVHTPKAATQTSQWFFASAGPKGKAYVDKHRGYFRKAMKHEGEGEAKVEESANLDGNSDDPTEKKTVKPTGASPANQFTLPPVLEDLVKGFADRYPETVIDTMLAALKKQYMMRTLQKRWICVHCRRSLAKTCLARAFVS